MLHVRITNDHWMQVSLAEAFISQNSEKLCFQSIRFHTRMQIKVLKIVKFSIKSYWLRRIPAVKESGPNQAFCEIEVMRGVRATS